MSIQPDHSTLNMRRIEAKIAEWARAGREVWLPVVGYEGFYSASSQGRIRSDHRVIIKSNGRRQTVRERYVSMHFLRTGYLAVSLVREGRAKTFTVHGLVASAFYGPMPFPTAQVRHLDGNRTNNAVANLLWGTPSQNTLDSIAHGTHPQARKQSCPQGHPYSPENTYRNPRGRRYCRTCLRAKERMRPSRAEYQRLRYQKARQQINGGRE